MHILPAIDIKDGRCIRLVQGEVTEEIEYHADPLEQAKIFESQGATHLHIVDLDGAVYGNPKNVDVIEKIVKSISCQVQVSGGIRSEEDIDCYKDINPWQIILGSVAVFDLNFVRQVLTNHDPAHFSIAVDAKDGFIMSRGWREMSDIKLDDLIKELDEIGIQRLIFTDVSRDGTLKGSNVEKTIEINNMFHGHVVASGGVNSIEEIKRLKEAGIHGVIIGKALHEKKMHLKEVLEHAI